MITITDYGRGEITFGAPQAGRDIEYSRLSVGFTWRASAKWPRSPARAPLNCSMTAPSRSNSHITTGDEAVLKAKRETS
jgi:hypothetical protein